ncbi:hypothetical protein AY601_3929 [Pedobacter cryoconitis]|uniref:DUF4197 domain-containing protein n=1 Tax=Pedobacter cryoconitis TaxID=188932 RepID=A0A127VHG8_9SPHI|nr:DUF4197 domain-containing protein [Pedobacter cryoconitis]AMQ00785.1 hypothetical protein AY601_3929 [Pedobacter cryoconitis]
MNKIKLASLAFAAIAFNSYTAQSQSLGSLLKKIKSATETKPATTQTATKTVTQTNGTTTTISTVVKPTNSEIGTGIKQALEAGISKGADQLSLKDGFLGNMAVKILFPPEAQKVEKTLRSIGLGSLADNVVTSLNRAAEDAAKEAKPIFVAAIKQMTITDATNILLGGENSATEYFKRATTAQLLEKFRPVVNASLSKVGAARYWGDATGQYNKLPLVKPVTTDLNAYVTQKAVEGMFIQVAQEELTIRNNLGGRTTSVLQKVFGYADQKK